MYGTKKLVHSRNYQFPYSTDDEDIEEILTQFLLQYYNRKDLPHEVFLDVEISNINEIQHVINEGIAKHKLKFLTPKKGAKYGLLEIAQKNARYQLQQQKTRLAKSKIILEEIQNELKLKKYPKQIECIDISNLQSESIVASKVCFLDAKANPSQYRHYNIKSTEKAR